MLLLSLCAFAAFAEADFIFHAVPVQYSRAALQKVAHLIRPDVPVVSLAKGIETTSLCVMSELIPQCLGDDQPVAFVSGPSFAKEIFYTARQFNPAEALEMGLINRIVPRALLDAYIENYTKTLQEITSNYWKVGSVCGACLHKVS